MKEKTNPVTRAIKFKAPIQATDTGREFVDVDLFAYDYEPSTGLAINRKHVIRGGAWHDSPDYLRSAGRVIASSPADRNADVGFRLIFQSKGNK